MAALKHLSASRGWQFVELTLDLDGPEGYLTLKLLELLNQQLGSYNILTLTILTTETLDGNLPEGAEGNRHESIFDDSQTTFF